MTFSDRHQLTVVINSVKEIEALSTRLDRLTAFPSGDADQKINNAIAYLREAQSLLNSLLEKVK